MNDVLAGLSKVADIVMTKLTSKINEVSAPSAIIETISKQSPVQDGNTGAHIDITIKHPAAAAFEWGSGVHSTKGAREEYEIVPKDAPLLAFPKERWPQYKPPPEAPDVFLFPKVSHPGVEPRPFIAPSVIETKAEVKKILGKAAKAQILMGVKQYEEIVIG